MASERLAPKTLRRMNYNPAHYTTAYVLVIIDVRNPWPFAPLHVAIDYSRN